MASTISSISCAVLIMWWWHLSLSSEGHVLLLWTWPSFWDTMQLLRPHNKNAMRFYLALLGCSLLEPSLHVVRKLTPAHVERIHGEALRLNEERDAKSPPSVLPSALPAPVTSCLQQHGSSWDKPFLNAWTIETMKENDCCCFNSLSYWSNLLCINSTHSILFSQNYLHSLVQGLISLLHDTCFKYIWETIMFFETTK